MCGGAKWKREVVPDHKFDFVDTHEFADNGFGMRMKYLWLYTLVLKDFLVYIADIFSATTMLTTTSWSNEIFNTCDETTDCVTIPFKIGRWLFVGCIIFSFLLLGYEGRKAKRIIASRDISYAFTNVMANHYYSLRSYDHFCFFDHISNSTKTSDDFAFFVFFTFKSWKRLLLADGPRQTINALTLYAVWLVKHDDGAWYDLSKYFDGNSLSTSALLVTTTFTTAVFCGSLLLLIIAGVCYIPLLFHIQGNLKVSLRLCQEYCCHKVDKRIDIVIKRRKKQRLATEAKNARKEAMGDFSHLKNSKGELIAKPLPQPTLPQLSLDDEGDDMSMRTGKTGARASPSAFASVDNLYNDKMSEYPPPMPAYNPHSVVQAPDAYARFNDSGSIVDAYSPYANAAYMYDEDNDSQAHLATSAAPLGRQTPSPGVQQQTGHFDVQQSQGQEWGNYDPADVYQGRAGHGQVVSPNPMRAVSPNPMYGRVSPTPLYAGRASPGPNYAYDQSTAYGGDANTFYQTSGVRS
ncbi:hypothetical protein FISHEDRAFT_46932 [Fistulina hepatica ATCC 64428]|uniref:Vacuole protein n=1 Tax=Fistulina hepatica ATCC 64428 TaxID=1128425 RepID=A0A0D7A798_9AGAR|nr:hypothetical protein FISHEDRAFT_46932 [Fistulina hepatica ATCC 64428]